MQKINHFRNFVKSPDKRRLTDPSSVISGGGIDPEFDDTATIEKEVAERIRERGRF
jgi:hypothetical protein